MSIATELITLASCENVTDIGQRRDILRRSNRCYICLSIGHRSFECKNNTKVCRKCNKVARHHQSICNLQAAQSRTDKQGNAPKDCRSKETADKVSATEHVKTTTTTKRGSTVLLQTARAVAKNTDGTKSTNVRILFDSGSQRSYVTNSLKSRLKLRPVKSETLHLNTFGENKYRKENCDVVHLRLLNHDDQEIEINAVSFPVICTPLRNKVETASFPHLEGLQLADHLTDSSAENDTIDVLIGSDFTGTLFRAKRFAVNVARQQLTVNLDGFCPAHCTIL